MDVAEAYRFTLALRELATPSACAALFREAVAPLGIDTFACGELDFENRQRTVFYIIDWPDRWREFYVQSGLVERDPVLAAMGRTRQPFTWSDLRERRALSSAGTEAFDLAQAEGWVDGLVVPMSGQGQRVGLVSLVARRQIEPTPRQFLTLVSISLHSHVRTLVAREGFALPPAGLSGREIAAIRLVAKGMTDGRIATALGVANSTAHEFVEKARVKLQVVNRAELVLVASALGLIDF